MIQRASQTEVLCACADSCVKDAEIERLRAALEPFAKVAVEDEAEVDYLVDKKGAVAAARTALKSVEQ